MSTELSTMSKQANLKNLLERARPSIAAVLPKHMTPERTIRIVLAMSSRTPALLNCTPLSVLNAVVQASQLGLEAGGALGGAYLVPFKDQCQLIIGYRGLIDLARRSGQIASIEAHVIHRADKYRIAFGLSPVLEHEPALSGEPGEMVAVYALASLRDGSRQIEVMTRAQVDAIRNRSKASASGPWVTDYDEMARKTVVKRLCKYLPLSVEMATALEVDNEAESEHGQTLEAVADVLPELTAAAAAEPKATAIKARLRRRAVSVSMPDGAPFEDESPTATDADMPPLIGREPGSDDE